MTSQNLRQVNRREPQFFMIYFKEQNMTAVHSFILNVTIANGKIFNLFTVSVTKTNTHVKLCPRAVL